MLKMFGYIMVGVFICLLVVFLIILFNVIEFFMLMICLFIVKSGLFEGELEDILVCDDDVFNDVYIYWILFLCCLLLLLFLRLKVDLNEYIGKFLNFNERIF